MNAKILEIKDLQSILKKYAELDMFSGFQIVSPLSSGPDGDTPFHMAAYDGDIEAVQIMLPFVHDINVGGDIGNSPLHYAVQHNHLEMAKFLISNGADARRENDYGDTPLDYMEGKEDFRDFL